MTQRTVMQAKPGKLCRVEDVDEGDVRDRGYRAIKYTLRSNGVARLVEFRVMNIRRIAYLKQVNSPI